MNNVEPDLNSTTCAYCHSEFKGDSNYCCQSCELLSKWSESGQSPLNSRSNQFTKWDKFNQIELENSFNTSESENHKKYFLYIKGLQCASCVHLLESLPQYCPNVISAKVNYLNSTLNVETRAEFGLGDLCNAIELLGYSPTPLNEKSDYEDARKKEKRDDLKRIGVAGAIAGNEMLFTIPIYAGLSGELGVIFNWISFALFLPLIFYVAIPFYRKAWAGLLIRRMSIDVMIVFALWAGFLLSTLSLIKGTNEFYFDSTASFIFLILATRYFQKSQQDKLLRKGLLNHIFSNDVYEIQTDQKTELCSFDLLKENQCLHVKKEQLVPCDSYLQSKSGEFDLSFLTGEAFPQTRHQGDLILAGSRVLQDEALLISTTTALQSKLALSLSRLDSERSSIGKNQSLSDLVSHRLTVIVFSIAIIYFLLTFNSLGFESFKRCLALITIACPCAVAFGTPLAHALGLKKAAKAGFFIKSENVFEKIQQIKEVIFDKTGTLTSSELELVQTFPSEIPNEVKSIILGLEKSSHHPVALSLKKIWSANDIYKIEDVKEIPGQGVRGYSGDRLYKFIKSEKGTDVTSIKVDLFSNDFLVASLLFAEYAKQEAVEVVTSLIKRGLKISMLTGDQPFRSQRVAALLGIDRENVITDQSSEEKKEFVQAHNPCLYVGDGLNDLEALDAAHVSFAIKGTFEVTLQVSDIYAPQKDLTSIREIFELSNLIQKAVKGNLGFALVYNVIGGVLALSGFINPLAAAVLMPISSLLITLHTVWRLK